MNLSPAIFRMCKRRRERSNRNITIQVGLVMSTLLSLSVIIVGLLSALIYSDITHDLPSHEILPILFDPPDGLLLQPTRFYDRSGQKAIYSIQNPAISERRFLSVGRATEQARSNSLTLQYNHPLILATIAVSDPDFWEHAGYTTSGLFSNEPDTLAQRLVSDFLLDGEAPGLRQALRERLMATQITEIYGRERILSWYLNSANYGHHAFGAETAARVYFGKSVIDLNVLEACLLAGVSEAPALNPFDTPEIARTRALDVIQKMLMQGLITSEQAKQAALSELTYSTPTKPAENPAAAFISLALEQLSARIKPTRLERGGLRIITSLDYDLQMQSSCAANTQAMRLWETGAELNTLEDQPCLAARLLPTLPPGVLVPPQQIEINLVVLDPHTGQVLAMSGLRASGSEGSESLSPIELEVLPILEHPVGTILSPVIYLTAFTRGYTPASLIWDIPGKETEGEYQNFDNAYHGPMRLRIALVNDYLVPVLQLVEQVGVENVLQVVEQMINQQVITSLKESPKAASLFDLPFTLLDLCQIYGILANEGVQAGWYGGEETQNNLQPKTVIQIEDADGNPWVDDAGESLEDTIQERPVISPQLAYLVNHILSDEVARWDSLGHPNALEIGQPAAAKVGRSISGSDYWTIGYTPDLVVGVWMDFQGAGQTVHPVKVITGLWHSLIQYASQKLTPAGWMIPAGINRVEVCNPSGMLPDKDCPAVVAEVFPVGSEPTQTDNLYQELQINRETGRLATIFTPPEFVEEHVFMMVPPEAKEWASQAGIETPPVEYDVILSASQRSPNARITSPSMLAFIKSKIQIRGTANGNNFDSYRIQTGKGLNPTEWLQIGQESRKPVQDGLLQSWDTKGLNGLYVLQLVVVHNDQSVENEFLQVTIDNQPPEITITSPGNGQEFKKSNKSEIIFQVQASDNLGVKRVDYYIDGKLEASLSQSPYALPWMVILGRHELKVRAVDLADNTVDTTIFFVINP